MRTVHQNDAFGIAPMRDTLYSPRDQMTRTEKSPLYGLCKSVAASMGVGRKPAGSLLFLSMHVFIHLISRVLVRATCPHPKGHLSHLSPRFNVENIARNQAPAIPSLCPAERFHPAGSQPHKPHCEDLGLPNPAPTVKQVHKARG